MANANHTPTPAPDRPYDPGSIFDAFACPSRKQLKLKKQDLPFVTTGRSASNWDVPATGGDLGGWETGQALGLMWMKYQRSRLAKGERHPHPGLADIAESMLKRLKEEVSKAMQKAARTGVYDDEAIRCVEAQCAGFLAVVSDLVELAIRDDMGGKLDEMRDADLLARANKGTSFDQQAYVEDMQDDEELQRYIKLSSQFFRGRP